MSSDVKLDGDWVIIDGTWTRLRTLDLMLDAPSRRSNNIGWRRALVHNPNDGLTINYNSDYPDGVKIEGKVSVDSVEGQNISSQNIKTHSLETGSVKVGQVTLAYSSVQGLHVGENMTNTYIGGRLVRVENDLTVGGEANFTEGIKVRDVVVSPEITPTNENNPEYQPYSLFERIRELQQTINELKRRIATLEGR